jgi:transcriptional regulator with XRE-family HTH domain
MPRPVTHRHVLRDLRHAIKHTQAQFAKLLGVSRVYINKIENGQMAVSPSLAIRVHVTTGINIDELAKGPDGKLVDLIGKPYSAETFIWWQKKFMRPNEKDMTLHARNLRWWILILLRAGAVHRKGVSYHALFAALVQSLNAIRRDFGLEETTDRLLSECLPPVKWLPGGRTPRELRAIDRELHEAQAQAEAQAQFFSKPGRRVYWQSPKPIEKQPLKKRRR